MRTDVPASLPQIDKSLFIVGNLDVILADVLIGNDIVTASGGLHWQYSGGGQLSSITFGGRECTDCQDASEGVPQVSAMQFYRKQPSTSLCECYSRWCRCDACHQ